MICGSFNFWSRYVLRVLGSNMPFKNRVFASLVVTFVTFKRFIDRSLTFIAKPKVLDLFFKNLYCLRHDLHCVIKIAYFVLKLTYITLFMFNRVLVGILLTKFTDIVTF